VTAPHSGEDEHAFWQRVYAANTKQAFELYLRHYPNGLYADIARVAISIEAPSEPAAPAPTAQR
jgi:hypothetical protein